jgi:hypothetical protein
MSKQYNKAEKRQRRQKYIKRRKITAKKPKAKAVQTAPAAA